MDEDMGQDSDDFADEDLDQPEPANKLKKILVAKPLVKKLQAAPQKLEPVQ